MCALSVYDKRVDADTLLECMARCQQETAFNCSTLDFHAGAVAGDPPACYLRSRNRTEVSADMEQTDYCYTSEKRHNGTLLWHTTQCYYATQIYATTAHNLKLLEHISQ